MGFYITFKWHFGNVRQMNRFFFSRIDARKALFAPLPLRSPIPENHSGTSLVGSEMALRSTAPRLTWPYLQTSSLLTSPRPIRRLKTRHYDPDDADDTSFPAEIVSQNPPKCKLFSYCS